MSLGGVITGTILQLMLGYFLFMLVVFSAGGIGGEVALGRWHARILTLAIFALPATCAVSAGIVLYAYVHGGSGASYEWYALPLALAVVYLVYALRLNRRAGRATPAGRDSDAGPFHGE